MNKFKLYKLFLLLPMFLLTGCWDSKDPENKAYIITMAIDLNDDYENGIYNFSFAPAKTHTQEVGILNSSGFTIASGVVGVDSKNPRKTNLGQLKIIILGQDIIRDENYFLPLFDELERSHEISEKVLILVTDENTKGEDVLNILVEEEQGLFLWDFYQNIGNDIAITKGLDLESLTVDFYMQEKSLIIPKISIENNKVLLGGSVALVDGKYAYTLTEEEEQGYLFLQGNGKGAIIECKNNDFYIPMEVIFQDINYKFYIDNSNELNLDIETSFTGDLLSSFNDNAFDIAKKAEIEELLKSEIQNKIRLTLNNALNFDAYESLGIYDKLRRYKNGKFSDYDTSNIKIDILVNLNIRDTGKIR